MRILVTGATGFIGSHLCRALIEAGHTVRALRRASSSTQLIRGLPLQEALGDLLDPPSLERAMQGVEVVFHCGGLVGGWRDAHRMIASHVHGTHNVLQAALQAGVDAFIHTSSVAALGLPDYPPGDASETIPLMTESHAWNASERIWPYGHAKHLAEEQVQAAVRRGLEARIVNPAAVMGAGDKNLVASAIIVHMARGRIPPIPPGGLNVVHIDDVVAGQLAALEHGRRGERYILSGENITLERLLTSIAETIGASPPRRRISRRTLSFSADAVELLSRFIRLPVRGHILRFAGLHFYYSNAKARDELGLKRWKNHRRAIEDAYAWYRDHGFC